VTIFKSILILSTVSAFIAGCLFLLNVSFFPVFGLSFIAQILIWNLFNNWKTQRAEIEFELIQNERIKEFSKQGLNCICPDENCNHKVLVPIVLNEENTYKCPECNKSIKVYIGAKTFLATTPVEEDPFKNFNFVEGKDYDN